MREKLILFVEDEADHFEGVTEYLKRHEYHCERVVSMTAGRVCGNSSLPDLLIDVIEKRFAKQAIEDLMKASREAQDNRSEELRRLKAAVVDLELLDETDGPPIVQALSRLRELAGADFRICVWSQVVKPDDISGYREVVRGWGADCLVAKQYRDGKLDAEKTGAKIRECVEQRG